jgi:hypothetical protein
VDLIEQGRSLLQAQSCASGVIHLFIARAGIDGKQIIHQGYDADRSGILLVELDGVDKVSSRVAPTGRMHHIRSTYIVVVVG